MITCRFLGALKRGYYLTYLLRLLMDRTESDGGRKVLRILLLTKLLGGGHDFC